MGSLALPWLAVCQADGEGTPVLGASLSPVVGLVETDVLWRVLALREDPAFCLGQGPGAWVWGWAWDLLSELVTVPAAWQEAAVPSQGPSLLLVTGCAVTASARPRSLMESRVLGSSAWSAVCLSRGWR